MEIFHQKAGACLDTESKDAPARSSTTRGDLLAGEALVDLVGRSRGCVPEATKGAHGFLPRIAQAFQRNIDIVSQRYYIFTVSTIVPF